jgi:hypothetical protein
MIATRRATLTDEDDEPYMWVYGWRAVLVGIAAPSSFDRFAQRKNIIMNLRVIVLSLLAAASANVFAQADEPAKFAYHCEWMEGSTRKWEVHHVNLPYKIVDGRPATLDGNAIVFVQDGIERKIDLQSGTMETHSLKSTSSAIEIRECKKIPALPL